MVFRVTFNHNRASCKLELDPVEPAAGPPEEKEVAEMASGSSCLKSEGLTRRKGRELGGTMVETHTNHTNTCGTTHC